MQIQRIAISCLILLGLGSAVHVNAQSDSIFACPRFDDLKAGKVVKSQFYRSLTDGNSWKLIDIAGNLDETSIPVQTPVEYTREIKYLEVTKTRGPEKYRYYFLCKLKFKNKANNDVVLTFGIDTNLYDDKYECKKPDDQRIIRCDPK